MSERIKWLGLVSLSSLVAISASAMPVSSDVSEETLRLRDPSRQMLGLCGGSRRAGELLRMRLQYAQEAMANMPAGAGKPILFPGLGTLQYPVTTSNAEAQRFFDQGMMLTYGFNNGEAIRSFQEAQRLDPQCAMCWWGEALAHGPNINAPMDPEVNAQAVAATQRAVALKAKAKPVEQALIDALATRYSADPKADRAALDKGYAERMLQVAERFPQDDNVAVLAAEAVMDTQPWDYWEADRKTPKGNIVKAISLVEGVLKRNPDHPQADHLYIHLMEASVHPERAESYADRLATPLVPAAGHLVHMPAHLYYRVGRFKDSIRVNVDAAKADEAYLKNAANPGLYRFGYYPHNVHFIVTSAQMAGDMKTAIEQAEKLRGIVDVDVTSKVAWLQPVSAAPYLAYSQFAAPKDIMALKAPDERLPYVSGMWRYARAVAHAQEKDKAAFDRELAALRAIREGTDFKPMVDQGVPAPDLLRLAETVAQARLAYAQGKYGKAVDLYRQAVAIEEAIPYMEPPYWYYPVKQSLGAALYRSGDLAGARQAFMEALAQAPNNGWALYGLARTQRTMGDRSGAAASEAALTNAWLGDRRWLVLDRL